MNSNRAGVIETDIRTLDTGSDLLNVLNQCRPTAKSKESSSRKNSAKYGRRAPSRNNSLVLDRNDTLLSVNVNVSITSEEDLDIKSPADSKNTKLSHQRRNKMSTNIADFNYSNKTLEESWSSLKVFDKKQKGRIHESDQEKLCKYEKLHVFRLMEYYQRQSDQTVNIR